MSKVKLLPIGTIVKVGVQDDLLMITSRYPLSVKDGITGYFDYSACLYPIGIMLNENPFLFNHDDIVEIIFEGYSNKLEENLIKYYNEKLKSSTYPKLNINN
ncbi:hypothetical protein SAMN05660772_02876 [Pasteurella testudinis DSM 23072]|uniref:DUF4176 domain-containing protein n=1 Tax=Pasteurella testudinis DSM 23072 TaxID=1122938 RepID=A0A1W1V7M9_9PAST|nr:DUF4176 domain-containing protein [Pasteurella testudinis]SMB89389.1 hypothetical protein SAMN05660772_02876 [Pasteurella testudinis DSM 23072]SUB52172.1 Uncharacterized protein conserved in bacteria [Pasteurella testudinis]